MFDSIYQHIMVRDGWRLDQKKYQYLHLDSSYHGTLPAENDVAIELLRGHKRTTIVCKIVNQHHWIMTPKKLRQIQEVYKGEADDPLLQFVMKNAYASTISHRYEYEIRDEKNGKQIALDGATWADFDKQKRLVLAKDGKIFSAAMDEEDKLIFTELVDFNHGRPQPHKPPTK